MDSKPIDIFITCFLRQAYTEKTLSYLFERTKYPYRLFVIDQGGNDEVLDAIKDKIFLRVKLIPNAGIHAAHNVALALAESEYFITSDNDIYVPDLEPDWLTQMVKFMDERPDYGAISLHPHVFIGAAGVDPSDPEDVKDRNMCGSVMRLHRTEVVRKISPWLHVVRTGRNHEERSLAAGLHDAGYKTGIATRIRAFHPFPPNWGYPPEFTPEQQMHNPALEQEVQRFGNIDSYDNKTWMPL